MIRLIVGGTQYGWGRRVAKSINAHVCTFAHAPVSRSRPVPVMPSPEIARAREAAEVAPPKKPRRGFSGYGEPFQHWGTQIPFRRVRTLGTAPRSAKPVSICSAGTTTVLTLAGPPFAGRLENAAGPPHS